MIRDYETACDAMIPVQDVVGYIRDHGHEVEVDRVAGVVRAWCELVRNGTVSRECVEFPFGEDGEIPGGTVLEWLGY